MKRNKQIITILALFFIVIVLLGIMGNPVEILHILFFMAVGFLGIFLKNNLARKKKISKAEKGPEVYSIPMLVRGDQPYLYIGAKGGCGFDYLMLPQNLSLQTRIDQIILGTENTEGIKTILGKDKIESFEDFQELLKFIIGSVPPIGIIGNKTRYSMDFGMRQLNIIVEANGSILTITF